jgi:hypothetical protein
VLRLWTLTDRYRSLLPAPHATVGESGVKDERALLDALAKKDRQRLLREFERDRSHIESMLLGLLGARDL